MMKNSLNITMEDYALEMVPLADRKGWLQITWSVAGVITTLVMLFLGALVCFVAGMKIALMAGLSSFCLASVIGWAIAKINFETGLSNTLITRKFGLGIKGSVLASIIFGSMIIGFLALENALIYRGILFFFSMEDVLLNQFMIYGGLSISWIVLTVFGFDLVSRFSSIMLIAFLVIIVWVVADIIAHSGLSLGEALFFSSQLPPGALAEMHIYSDWDKYIFCINILIAPACTLALNTADFGRYGKSTRDVATAATIGIFFQSLLVMMIGGVLMHAGAQAMVEYYANVENMGLVEARHNLLRNPDSIAATFMVFGGATGFILMMLAQTKAQVLNTYSSSLSLANFFDASCKWRPGRFAFVIIANIIALLMLYGHILEFVESWIKLLGVLMGSLAGLIMVDYYLVSSRDDRSAAGVKEDELVNWAGVITIIISVLLSHFILTAYMRVEVISVLFCVLVIYPILRLTVFNQKLGLEI